MKAFAFVLAAILSSGAMASGKPDVDVAIYKCQSKVVDAVRESTSGGELDAAAKKASALGMDNVVFATCFAEYSMALMADKGHNERLQGAVMDMLGKATPFVEKISKSGGDVNKVSNMALEAAKEFGAEFYKAKTEEELNSIKVTVK